MKKQYKVIIGRHIEGGKTYKKDEIVVTETNLCELFPQKFIDLGPAPAEPAPEKSAEADEESPTDPPTKPAPKSSPKSKKGKASKVDDDWDD